MRRFWGSKVGVQCPIEECRRGVRLSSLGHWATESFLTHGQTNGYLPGRRVLSLSRLSFPVPLRVGGWVGLNGIPWTVTHLSTNRARRRVTWLMWVTTLPEGQATTRGIGYLWLFRQAGVLHNRRPLRFSPNALYADYAMLNCQFL